MSKPIFSILTPTYNCAEFILRSYHSLLSQTKSDWEWIIVDDGSLDNTKEIISRIDDSRIKFHTYEKNKGRGFARNFGLTQCVGEIVVVWDIDDIYLPDRLESVYDAIIKENFDFMVAKAIVVDNHFNFKGIRGFTVTKLFKSFVHPTLAFKSNLIQEINYDKSMAAGEDLFVMFKLSNMYSGKYLDKNLMLYFEDREVNLKKTMQMHESHSFTIKKILKEEYIKISTIESLMIKFSLFAKKMILKMFLLKPSLYLKTVQFRKKSTINEKDKIEIVNFIDKIKKEYYNL